MKTTPLASQKSTYARKHYSVTANHDRLPKITVSKEDLEKVEIQTFGSNEEIRVVPASDYVDSPWSRKYDQFYRERIVHVRSNNVLLLRFDYSYEVDLDRIHCERDLLAWVLQLVEKPWMGAERVKLFAYVVADIKDFNIHGL
jgi:hypothetical protein